MSAPKHYTFHVEPKEAGGKSVTVSLDEAAIGPTFKRKRGSERGPDSYTLIGFDTEYQSPGTISLDELDPENPRHNRILSYQFYVAILRRGNEDAECMVSGLIVPQEDQRIMVEDFVGFALGSFASQHPMIKLPPDVYLIGHFTRADLPAFSDFAEQAKELLNNVRNTFLTLDRSMKLSFWSGESKPIVNLRIRDTMLLVPADRKSLDQVGELVDVEKIPLGSSKEEEQAIKENMEKLRAENWPKFREYAIRDAEICVRYAVRIISRYFELFGVFAMPATLTTFGVDQLVRGWERDGIDRLRILGREQVKAYHWDKKHAKYNVSKNEIFQESIYFDVPFVTECYHGGRNEQFMFGPAPLGDWTDYDLSSAYPTAMSLIGMPDWSRLEVVDDDSHVDSLDLAFVCVDFEFGEHVRFPSLPVRTSTGIIFPRRGRSYCGAPELNVARALGAKTSIVRGIRVSTDKDQPIFAGFIKDAICRRGQYPTGTFDNLFWKEISNSTYGKTAQGLMKRRVFDIRSGGTLDLPPSKITQPFFASFITSFTRALLGEILNDLDDSTKVFSVTTDGFLSQASVEEVERAKKGQLCRNFAKARQKLTGKDEPLEPKHYVRQPIGWRTRGSATIVRGPGEKGTILQKGGIRTKASGDIEAENREIVQLFLSRRPNDKIELSSGISLREMVLKGHDFVRVTREKNLSMEFDWKRVPTSRDDVGFIFANQKWTHLAFDTRPLDSIEEYESHREAWWKFTQRERKNLKTTDDLEGFLRFVSSQNAPKEVRHYRPRKPEGNIVMLRRSLCLAFRNERSASKEKGGDGDGKLFKADGKPWPSNGEFADLLSGCGIPCKRYDVENARSPFMPHCVEWADDTVEALTRLKQKHFPNLEIELFLYQATLQ